MLVLAEAVLPSPGDGVDTKLPREVLAVYVQALALAADSAHASVVPVRHAEAASLVAHESARRDAASGTEVHGDLVTDRKRARGGQALAAVCGLEHLGDLGAHDHLNLSHGLGHLDDALDVADLLLVGLGLVLELKAQTGEAVGHVSDVPRASHRLKNLSRGLACVHVLPLLSDGPSYSTGSLPL